MSINILNAFKPIWIQTCSELLRKESAVVSHFHVPHFHDFHAPNWFFIIGMPVGIIILPVMILGSLFLIFKAIIGM